MVNVTLLPDKAADTLIAFAACKDKSLAPTETLLATLILCAAFRLKLLPDVPAAEIAPLIVISPDD